MRKDENRRLYARLKEYADSGIYPFHMPGHKRRFSPEEAGEVYRMDITEIDGFDNLHDARGILLEAEQYAARLYGAEETFFCVNGSTGAILAAVSTVCSAGGRILAARNCHKSVYHAIEINHLEVSYIYPQVNARYAVCEGIYPQDIDKEWIKAPDIQAIVITSPTYDGVVSDIRQICSEAHERGIPVIVDEAHGAHFPFSGYFPESALQCGADIVIHSTHKTLPAMTQTALLHVCGDLVDRERLRRMLTVYQTSSPSYILMGSIDDCMHLLDSRGEAMFARYTQRLENLRRQLAGTERIHLLEQSDLDPERSFDYDRSKLLLSAGPGTGGGKRLYQQLLEEFGLQMEMMTSDYVLAMTSVCDDEEGFQRLLEAVRKLNEEAKKAGAGEPDQTKEQAIGQEVEQAADREMAQLPQPVRVLPVWDAFRRDKEKILLADAAGRIAAEYVYLYPPGVPLLVPGEQIDDAALRQILHWERAGMDIAGIYRQGNGEIMISAVRQDG